MKRGNRSQATGVRALVVVCVAGCMLQVSGFAQGALPSCAFEWDAPEKMDFVTGYRLQWGPQAFADTPIHQTTYTVENFPTGWNLPVSVYSLGTTTNSEPTTIHVFNVTAAVEESSDLVTWTPVATVRLSGPRRASSFLRLKLSGDH